MCDMARAYGEKVTKAVDNCNLLPDACSTPKAFRIPCSKRAASVRYTFTAVERSLDDDDLVCSGQSGTMLLGIMLRDPLAGIKSTWIGNELDKGAILRAMRTGVVPRGFGFHFCLPPLDTYQHFDNFAVRTLSGDYDLAPGAMTAEHLAKAKEVLLKLDVVLIMEELSDHLAQLRAFFGWQVDLSRSPWKSHGHKIPKNALTDEEEAFLKKANELDYELFDFGKSLARQLTAHAQRRLAF
ncbi:unnamed protein product [Effrenium voratum]|nr:unnamed protein product [Effrenium voratum]